MYLNLCRTQVWFRGHACLLEMRINLNCRTQFVHDPLMNSKKKFDIYAIFI